MSDQTLYLVQSAFQHTEATLTRLKQLAQTADAVVLMGDAVLHLDSAIDVLLRSSLYILQSETDLLADSLPDHVKALSYSEFADLVLQFKRCISLK